MPAAEPPSERDRGGRPAARRGRCRILVVEDHADTRHLLGMLLKRWGHDVVEAGSLEEAAPLVAAPRAAFDVLVADLELPDGRTEPLIRAFKRRFPRALAVVASGHAYPRDVAAATAAGADHYLAKPFPPDALEAVIARLADCPETGGAGA